jgi:hypothetical protein
MTVGLSGTNTAKAWLDVLKGGGTGVTFTAPAALFVQLHTADPGASGTNAVSVGSATRNAVTQGAATTGGVQANSAAPSAWTNGGTSETLTHISVWSLASAGTFYYSVALTSSQAWASGNTFTLTSLGVSLTPIAA